MHYKILTNIPYEDPIIIFSIIILSIIVVSIISRKFKIPDIIVLIIIGMILGPYCLGLIKNDKVMELFSKIGIMFVMFLAGLEIDENHFKKNFNKSVFFGILTFSVPMVLGFLSGYNILKLNILQSILLASMFASHTLLTYPLVVKLNLAKKEVVGIVVGGTIITDVAALLVFAIITSINKGEFNGIVAFKMISTIVLFSLLLIIILPKIYCVVYNKTENNGDIQFIFTLLVLFLSGILSEIAGIEPIIGAFFAGIAVGKRVEPISPLVNRLKFFGNTLFIPSFLLSVGLLINPGVFFSNKYTLLVSLVMSLCVIIAKFLASLLAVVTFRWNFWNTFLIFGLSVPQAAATLAVILASYTLGIFDQNILNGTIVMIITSVIAGTLSVQLSSYYLNKDNEKLIEKTNNNIVFEIDENFESLFNFVLTSFINKNIFAFKIVEPSNWNLLDIKNVESQLNILNERASEHGIKITSKIRSDYYSIDAIINSVIEFNGKYFITKIKKTNIFSYFTGDLSTKQLINKSPFNIICVNLNNKNIYYYKEIRIILTEINIIDDQIIDNLNIIFDFKKNIKAKLILYCSENMKEQLIKIYGKDINIDDFVIIEKFDQDLIINNNNIIYIFIASDYLKNNQKILKLINNYIKNISFIVFFNIKNKKNINFLNIIKEKIKKNI